MTRVRMEGRRQSENRRDGWRWFRGVDPAATGVIKYEIELCCQWDFDSMRLAYCLMRSFQVAYEVHFDGWDS